jgi:general secretion pathway protein E
MRILDRRRAQVPFGRLGLAEWILDPVKRIMERPHGIFLVTGPTGSGKSTTLYAMLSLVNALESKVITVEDPVEYELPLIRQCQVNPEIGLTFAAGLRSILRQDPDVIMVGEIRDKETAEIAIRAALTGHLVLSTLHTNTAIGALSRLTDMGIDPFLVNSTLAGVLAQRLIRVLCKKCKSKRPATKEEIERFHQETRSRVKDLYAAIGCAACGGTGYSGRTGIHELFLLDDRIRKLVAAGRPEEELLQAAEAAGFKDLHRSGEEKVLRGETTIEEVGRVALSGH